MYDTSSLPIFSGVAPEKLALLNSDMLRFYKTGDCIVSENDPGLHLVVLLSGEGRVSADGTYLVTRRAGEIIGEQAILDGTGRSATVLAQGMVKALVIPAAIIDQLFTDSVFSRNIARALSTKLREATGQRAVRYRQEEQLFGEFSAHVSPELASRLLATGEDYGKPRFVDVVLLMADIRGFTDACARMEPNEIASELGPYLDSVVAIIHRHGGMVDKFIGDAVLAVWGVTAHVDEQSAPAALITAREMIVAASEMHFGGAPIRIGVGLNAGRVFAGNVGGIGKRQFTVLGTPVNVVARLESECKTLNASIVAGETFYRLLSPGDRAGFLKHTNVAMKGAGAQSVFSMSLPKVQGATQG